MNSGDSHTIQYLIIHCTNPLIKGIHLGTQTPGGREETRVKSPEIHRISGVEYSFDPKHKVQTLSTRLHGFIQDARRGLSQCVEVCVRGVVCVCVFMQLTTEIVQEQSGHGGL